MNNQRRNTFIRWWVQQLWTLDCDPSIYMMQYVIDRMELNEEQRFWFCWIYANTYHLPTAWVIFNEFPDYENTPIDRISRWSDNNRARLPYQKDQKWLRGCLGETFGSYKAWVGLDTQRSRFNRALPINVGFPRDNFQILWTTILKDFHKFGRYTTWFYLQTLKEVCKLDLEPTSLMLDFDASATHRAGLCYALGYDSWAAKGYKFSPEQFKVLDFEASTILYEVKRYFPTQNLPVKADYFSMETALCSFKKLFRRKQGRYLGFYLDRQAEDITKTASMDWPGINWKLLWDARDECIPPGMNFSAVEKSKFNWFLDTGDFLPRNLFGVKLQERYMLESPKHLQ